MHTPPPIAANGSGKAPQGAEGNPVGCQTVPAHVHPGPGDGEEQPVGSGDAAVAPDAKGESGGTHPPLTHTQVVAG